MDSWINFHLILLIFHLFGLALGAGAAFLGDFIFLNSVRNKLLLESQTSIMNLAGKIVWLGLFILLLSGIGLTWQRPEIFLHSGKFWAKMTVISIIVINGLAFHFIYRPTLDKSVGKKFSASDKIIKIRGWLMVSGAVSVASWNYALILGVLRRTPFSYLQFMGFYAVLLILTVIIALLLRKTILSPSKKLTNKF